MVAKRIKALIMAGVIGLAAPAIACPAGDLQPGQWSFVIAGQGGVGAGGIGHFCVADEPNSGGVQQISGSFEAHWPDNKASQKTFTGTLTQRQDGLAEQMDITITTANGKTSQQSIHIEGGSPAPHFDANGSEIVLTTEYDGRVLKPVGDAMTVHGIYQSQQCSANQ